MLQAMSEKMKGWPAIIVLGVATFAMSFFGIEGYFSSRVDTYVAKVGKHEISQQQFRDRMNQIRQQAMAQEGDQFDGTAFEKPANKRRILDAMVDQQLLLKANGDLGMRVSTQALRDAIANVPAFQVNGKFDPETYRSVLAANRMTPEMFEEQQSSSMAVALLPDAINDSAIVTDADMDRYLDLQLQRRDVQYFTLPRPAPANSSVTDDEIASYYKGHQADFMRPEQVSLKYIEVNDADLKLDAQPSEDELKKRYQDEKSRFVQPEQRLVSHILINVPKNATPAQQKAALAKADKIAAEATPADFAELAKKDSDDLGSKSQGGNLGWLQKGVTNAAFDTAMFSLKKGEISKPVLSPEGYHIIYLRDVQSGKIKPFDQVRAELAQEAIKADREHKFNEVAGKLADASYQTPGSLDTAAKNLDLPVKTTGLFSHSGGTGIAANAKVIAAAFSDDVLAQGNNSSLINLGTDDAVVVRVDKHEPKAVRPLAEVSDSIKQKILDDRVIAAAKQRADGLLARLRKGEDIQAVAKSAGANVVSVSDAMRMPRAPSAQSMPAQVRSQAFLLPHPAKDKPEFSSVAVGDGVFAIVGVDKVQGGDLAKITPAQREQLRNQMAQAFGNMATHGFIDILKAKTPVKIAEDRM
ncbi:SurA N-terminal domain-containing protein [Rhodanobacter sp. 115]|uniref:SurA N-terminal domain-containing protein n=1 Tax=Rhodanobacter sp. FW021-MT20 TaxID=1162282 RepID=UPI000260CE76|nr:SurA N-terminal domain-containing protein [Rhodanobacter sp. 115]EIL88659.1 peptidyl-prolyl cis-trans isomerase [Rhodanobacter sp. 115]